jgi:hypothetical protein
VTETLMLDVFYIAVTMLFFVVAVAYIVACDWLG